MFRELRQVADNKNPPGLGAACGWALGLVSKALNYLDTLTPRTRERRQQQSGLCVVVKVIAFVDPECVPRQPVFNFG